MSKKLGNEPAFPVTENVIAMANLGMSKRFYAACAAMHGLLANELYMKDATKYTVENRLNLIPEIIKNAYSCADELLKQENNE